MYPSNMKLCHVTNQLFDMKFQRNRDPNDIIEPTKYLKQLVQQAVLDEGSPNFQ